MGREKGRRGRKGRASHKLRDVLQKLSPKIYKELLQISKARIIKRKSHLKS